MDENVSDILHISDRLSVLKLIGPALMVLGVFLSWLSLWGFNASGWKILTEGGEEFTYFFVPAVVLVVGLIALLIRLMSIVRQKNLDYGQNIAIFAVSVLMFLITIILMILYNGEIDGHIGAGYILSLIGALISIVRPLIDKFF
jgi:hypothetical protein